MLMSLAAAGQPGMLQAAPVSALFQHTLKQPTPLISARQKIQKKSKPKLSSNRRLPRMILLRLDSSPLRASFQIRIQNFNFTPDKTHKFYPPIIIFQKSEIPNKTTPNQKPASKIQPIIFRSTEKSPLETPLQGKTSGFCRVELKAQHSNTFIS